MNPLARPLYVPASVSHRCGRLMPLADAVRLPPAFLPPIEASVIPDAISLSRSRASHCRGLEARNTREPTPMAAGGPAREAAVPVTSTMDDH